MRTLRDHVQQSRQYLLPALGRWKITDVTRRDIEFMVELPTRVRRNRVLALTSRLFRLFETWEWRAQNSNPAQGVERAREEARDRALSVAELKARAKALTDAEQRHPAPVAAVRFAAVTGLRIGEILGVQWDHIQFETGRLLLPTTKTGRRMHDLPPAAFDILSALSRINKWCFTSVRDSAVTYRTVRTVFATAARAAGLSDARLHDLRRTFMTSATRTGIGTDVLRDLLGHRTTAMADRYIRSLENSVRDARVHMGTEMAAAMVGESSDVMRREE